MDPREELWVNDPTREWRMDGPCPAHPWLGSDCLICGRPASYPYAIVRGPERVEPRPVEGRA